MRPAGFIRSRVLLTALFCAGFWTRVAWPQVPTLPLPLNPPSTPSPPAAKGKTAGNETPKEKVAAPEGPIQVQRSVHDRDIARTLRGLLPRFPGVRTVDIQVDRGFVTLDGHVDNEDTADEVTKFTERVEGVRLVLNRLKTDAEVLSARQLAMQELRSYRDLFARKWVVALVALGVVLLFLLLARLFDRYSETLLAPFVRNVLLRSVAGSVVSSLLVFAGLMIALSALNLTRAVLSIVGLAGVVGLAVGFAFRDIAENFIASLLLGMRRPFQIGDYLQVAGQSGVVRSLNTRATVLVTLEGHHVRIPNSVIFKEILVNQTASPSIRMTFDVVIPYSASTAAAIDAIEQALRGQQGIQADPPPQTLVDALQTDGIHLRVYFWIPSRGVNQFQLMSDAKLQAKVALQKVGIFSTQPPPASGSSASQAAPAEASQPSSQWAANGRAGASGHHPEPEPKPRAHADANANANANLRQDSQAAAAAAAKPAAPPDGQATPMDHVLEQADTCVSDEGDNLLKSCK